MMLSHGLEILERGYIIIGELHVCVNVSEGRTCLRNIIYGTKQEKKYRCTYEGFSRSVDQKDEIQAYTKSRSKLVCSLKQLMTERSTT